MRGGESQPGNVVKILPGQNMEPRLPETFRQATSATKQVNRR